MSIDFSIVIPAKNEQDNLPSLLAELNNLLPGIEIIVVNDGSSDDTAIIAEKLGCRVINHPYSLGNGAAIKSGARTATSEYILFMDADGQHNPEHINLLLKEVKKGFDMVIGARDMKSQANFLRRIANGIYNYIASKVTGHHISDLTSGFRIVNRQIFNNYLYLLPNGFSYPTTSTMAFLRSGFSISFVPIEARKRQGKSHINPIIDGMRFIIIILKVGSLYSPLKFFTPVSGLFFALGLCNYLYTFFTRGAFTNMSALLIIVSFIIFMFGLLAEQITVLTYASSQKNNRD